MEKWVMTVFNSYQWDLNYTNPEVFLEMLANLVKLTDLGVDVVRFDALAFLKPKKFSTDKSFNSIDYVESTRNIPTFTEQGE